MKFTVPVLWDTKHKTIVNNESSEIIRIFNSAFNAFATNPTLDLYPEALRQDIDAINAVVYDNINNGVYKCGFAQSQPAYNAAVESLYAALDQVEEVLSRQRYLVGSTFTEADVRLFMTLVRFDEVYVVYFKTNKKRIADYPHMHNYCRELYQMPAFRATIDMEHIKVRHVLPPSHIEQHFASSSPPRCSSPDPLLHLAPQAQPVCHHPCRPERFARVLPAPQPCVQVRGL
jgi:putative glutathione S-transferase